MIRDWDTYTLPERERRVLGALAEALYVPLGTGLGPSAREDAIRQVVDDVQVWLGSPNIMVRTAFRALLLPLEVSPIRYGFGARRMSDLPVEARIRYIAALDAADSAPLDAWKSIMGLSYFARPVGAEHLDLGEQPPVARASGAHQ